MTRISNATWGGARMGVAQAPHFFAMYMPARISMSVATKDFADQIVRLANSQFWCALASTTEAPIRPGQLLCRLTILLKAEYSDQAQDLLGAKIRNLYDLEKDWETPEQLIAKIFELIGRPTICPPSDQAIMLNSMIGSFPHTPSM